MSVPFRFIHASDFHLDRPLRGLTEVPEQLRTALADAPYRAAERVFDAALKEHVDFVVLAGDLIDEALAGPRGVVFLREQFRRLAERGVQVYWALGRADRQVDASDHWHKAAGLTRIAGERVELHVHKRGDQPVAQILGTSTQQRKRIRLADFQVESGAPFTIAVAHGAADADTLMRHAVDYWALGGEHQRRSLLTGPTVAHYCGSPQGRKPQESGPHGCTLVHVDEARQVRTSFIPTDAVRYVSERVAINDLTTAEQLYQVLSEHANELSSDPFGPDLLVEWIVEGSKGTSGQLRRGKLAADLVARLRAELAQRRPSVWTLAVEPDSAGGDVAPARYDEDTLLGELLRTVRHYEENSEAPLDLEPYLSQRHVAGSLGATVALDDPAERRRVLAEVARLGVELLSPEEPRP